MSTNSKNICYPSLDKEISKYIGKYYCIRWTLHVTTSRFRIVLDECSEPEMHASPVKLEDICFMTYILSLDQYN